MNPLGDGSGIPEQEASTAIHGAQDLQCLRVDAYNAELHDPSSQGFLGDRASNRAFVAILEDWRERVRRGGDGNDPLEAAVGRTIPAQEIGRDKLDDVLQAATRIPRQPTLSNRPSRILLRNQSDTVRRVECRFLHLAAEA